MKNFFKNKIVTALILVATVVLAGIAIFTAYRLYQLRQTSVAPNVPSSKPKAQEVPTPTGCSVLAFTISTSTPTPTPTPTPTATSRPMQCNDGIDNDGDGKIDCRSGNADPGCYPNGIGGGGSCNPNDDSEADGTYPVATAAPTQAPQLPNSGFSTPTIIGAGTGILLLLTSLALIL